MSDSSADTTARRLAAIVESSDDAIVSKDLNGIVLSWNGAAERMFGYTAAEVVGRSITLIIPEDRLDEEREVLSRIRRGETVDHFETIRRRKNGELLDISLTVSPIRESSGRIVGASKIARDISEQKRLRQQVETASRLKDEFLATLSHELRTPLNAILGYARILRMRGAADGSGKALEIIERNAAVLTQLIGDVLDVSRIVSGKVRLNVQACDVTAVVAAAMDALRPAMDAKALTVHTELSSDASPILGDPDRLQQVFWNVLSNAVKFTPRGGRIDVTARRVDATVEVIVKDTGIGVDRAFLPYMFDRFRQANSTFSREHGGLGLGLALVRHFVELHGGTVRADSPGPDQGMSIVIELPLMLGKLDRSSLPPSSAEAAESVLMTRPLTRYVVLAVDDNADSLAMLSDVLKESGAKVVAARSSAEALGELTRHTFDVMVADISMPDMDGYSLIRDVRKQHGDAMAAVALTAYARPEDRTRALLSGFQTHLVKPIDPVELVTAIVALGRRRSGAV